VPYRSEAFSQARTRTARLAELRDLEASFTEAFWSDVAPLLGLRRWCGSEATSVEEELRGLDERLQALRTVLVRGLEHVWTRAANDALASTRDYNAEAAACRARVACALTELTPQGRVELRVVAEGVGARWSLSKPISLGVASCTIEPERLLDDLRKLAGLVRDIEVGDEVFDGAFLVQGHESTARAVLTRGARTALLRLGACTRHMAARVGRGEARVTIRGEASVHVVREALTVLEHLLRAPARALRT
jgi:hypothetical protein